VSLAKKTGEFKAAARSAAPLVLKVLASIAISAGLVVGGVQGWKWASTSPRFALTEVVFSGNLRASSQELGRLAGLAPGQNLVAMDVGAVEHALAGHPWVKNVRVSRRFPSQLDVKVTEHEAAAVASLGDLYLVDLEGEPFKRLQASDDVDLPIITGVSREELVADRKHAVVQLGRAVDAMRGWSRAKEASLSGAQVGPDGVVLSTEAGEEIRLGDTPLSEALPRLKRVKGELSKRALVAQVIRLDDRVRPSRVTVQVRPQSPEKVERARK
jgi:cell division protein FtsQ